jgi:hypothetical protein
MDAATAMRQGWKRDAAAGTEPDQPNVAGLVAAEALKVLPKP